MERLDFVLPDFTRQSWVSDAAREVWEPRVRRIGEAWFEMEWRAVLEGVRSCGLTFASPEGLVEAAGTWARHGLSGVPLQMQGVTGSYAAAGASCEPGHPFLFRIVVGRPDSVAEFQAAWERADDAAMGRLLGYPSCCLRFFNDVWVDGRMLDTTWPMAVATVAPENGTKVLEVSGPPQVNILWRWMGVRAVPHLPCRFDCPETVAFADAMIAVGRKSGFEEEMDWLLEILDWPVEWSALHGIAEIRTPVLKVSTRTDATPGKYVVRRAGEAYPPEGATGLAFPYERPLRPILTTSKGFREGLERPLRPPEELPSWYASDNGFATRYAMQRAHEPIVALATAVLPGEGGSVVDLGCGNGALLRKIAAARPAAAVWGVESDPERAAHAAELLPAHAERVVAADLFEAEEPWTDGRRHTLALLMPGRLLEAEPRKARRLLERLRGRCDHLLVYAYGDWLTRHGSLGSLARKAGLVLLGPDPDVKAGLARVAATRLSPDGGMA